MNSRPLEETRPVDLCTFFVSPQPDLSRLLITDFGTANHLIDGAGGGHTARVIFGSLARYTRPI